MIASRAGLVALSLAAAGCGGTTGKSVREIATNVVTLQSGDVTSIREKRGTGPFREYPLAPPAMLDLAAEALRTRVVAVFPNPHAGEVIAKERTAELATDDDYAPPWLSAVVVIVHPVPDAPGRSRVEVHATNRGAFHRGTIDWENDVPALLDRMVAQRTRPSPARLR